MNSVDAALYLGLSAALVAPTGILAFALFYFRGQARRAMERLDDLSDGAVFLLSNGHVVDCSEKSVELFGDLRGQTLQNLFDQLLPEDAETLESELRTLQTTGRAIDLILRDQDYQRWEVIGAPLGARLKIVLREAGSLEARLEEADHRLAERERALTSNRWERETFRGLMEYAPLISWIRSEQGKVMWAQGQVMTRSGTVRAEQAVNMLKMRREGRSFEAVRGAKIEKSRIELSAYGGSEGQPLQVVEIVRPDGYRVGFAIDASGVAGAERTLTRFVQTMTETFAHLTVGLAIFDRNQTLALFNPALAQMWQVEAAWLARRPTLREIIDKLRASRRIPEMAHFHEWRERLMGLFDNTETVDYEELWHLADGSNVNVLARPHPHGSLAFVFDDVTERMRLEQRYRKSIDLRRETLNRLEEGVAVFGPDGRLQFANQSFYKIWTADEEAIAPHIHARELISFCQALTVETEVWDRVAAFITADAARDAWQSRLTMGSGRSLLARFGALPDGSSMLLFADTTDSERIAQALRERNEALEAAEEMRSAVLDQISHRLRTPLNTIFGFGQLIVDQRFGTLTERQREYANGILEASGHLLDTIDDVTELASLQLDPMLDANAEAELGSTMELTRQLLAKRAGEARVTLSMEPPNQAVKLTCDAVRFRQLIFNLTSAAISESAEGGHVAMRGALAGLTGLEVAVSWTREETGPGDETLALSMIRRLVEKESGRFRLEQEADGGVACAICSFEDMRPPLAASDDAEALRAAEEEAEEVYFDMAAGDDPERELLALLEATGAPATLDPSPPRVSAEGEAEIAEDDETLSDETIGKPASEDPSPLASALSPKDSF
ncbi:MAG: PAS-domain containing protein [Pseudomonadota bacterium]